MYHHNSTTYSPQWIQPVNAATQKRKKRALLAIVFLILGAFSNDLLSIEVAGIFIEPFKISIVIGVLLCITFIRFDILGLKRTSYKNLRLSIIVYAFLIYNLSLIASIFIGDHLSNARKINYLLLNIGSVLFVINISSTIISSKSTVVYSKILKVVHIIFVLSLIISTLQVLLNKTFFDGIGIYYDNNIIPKGVHNERLAYAEMLTLGMSSFIIHSNIQKKSNNNILKLLIFIWVFALILLSGSFTGMIGMLLTLIPFGGRKLNLVKFIKNLTIGIVISALFIPFALNSILDDDKESLINTKIERYFENPEQGNYRYFSSLFLLNEFGNNPTFLGNGYKSNVEFLVQVNPLKKEVSSHTFISIIHDQGIIGIAVFFIMLVIQIYYSIRLLRNISSIRDRNLYAGTVLALVFSGLTFLRFATYYHATHQWLYLITFILLYTTNRQLDK